MRQQAIDTLVEIYRHVGEKVRSDIAKRGIPDAKYDLLNNALQRLLSFRLKQLYEKFDDVVANGRMITKSNETSDDSMNI